MCRRSGLKTKYRAGSMLGVIGGRASGVLVKLVQVSVGVALMIALAAGVRAALPANPDHAGWRIIRPPAEVSALVMQGGIIWAGGRDGLVAVDRISVHLLPLAGGGEIRYVNDLLVDRQNDLWIAHRGGLTRYSKGEWRNVDVERSLGGAVTALFEDRGGTLWVGSDQGVARRDGGQWRAYTARDGLAFPQVSTIFQDRDGTMWFGSSSPSQGGLTSHDGAVWTTYTAAVGLAHNSINAIIQDRSGAIWVATGFANRGGASRLVAGRWSSLSRSDGLAGEKVRSLFEDGDGRLWFGSEYDGIAVHDRNTWRVLTPNDGLAGWEVKKMLQDPGGAFWLGTEDGLTRIEKLD